MTRTETYRKLVSQNTEGHPWSDSSMLESDYWMSRVITECGGAELSPCLKRGRFEARMLQNLLIDVNDLELLVGRFSGKFAPDPSAAEEIAAYREKKEAYNLSGWGSNATSHRVVDYEKLLRLGIGGILAEIDSYLEKLPAEDTRRDFYVASRESIRSVALLAERYRDALLEKAAAASAPRREELLCMADVLSRVPMQPAKTFYEALQSMWLMQFALLAVGDISLTGRFDQYMYPYYEADLAAGRLTREKALELIEQLYYKHNEVYAAWPSSVMVCGMDRAGNHVLNDLSYLCIEAIGTTKLVNPSVNVAWYPELPKDFMDLCMKQIAEGYTRPAFFNDDLIQKGLREAGVSEEDARYYIHSTCVEITPIAASNVNVATPYINLNKAFEFVLGEGKQLYGSDCLVNCEPWFTLESLTDFASFRGAIELCLRKIIRNELTRTTEMLNHRIRFNSSPLASVLINDCLAKGMDVGSGGGRYSMVYPCFPGFINLIDSLAAVRKAVYEDHKLTLRELSDACRENFPNETVRQYLLNGCPKFGNDVPEVDVIGEELYALIREELSAFRTEVGATFYPSFFAWIMHGRLGREASALPDGRRQGEALSEHLGAMQGRDKAGPLAVIRSIARIPQHYGIGGIATNFRFSKGLAASAVGRDAIESLIAGFMDMKCFELQFNIVSTQDLLDAKAHPEEHQSLLVRVAGYSDYFVNLDPVIQDEILKRTEHETF